jgi:hypothetical protein
MLQNKQAPRFSPSARMFLVTVSMNNDEFPNSAKLRYC